MKAKPTVLVIDIGNTSTTLGIVKGDRVQQVQRIEMKAQSDASINDVVKKTLQSLPVDGVAIASVVPAINARWEANVSEITGKKVLWIDHTVSLGISVTYPKPQTIGADRLANAAGGVRRYGAPLIIADFGTAVTFDLVTRKQGYIGGIIAPGLPLMFDYLAERTAKLPHISWAPVRGRIGKSTAEAMQLGAHWGYRGMVREILTELQKSPALRSAKICATGGYAARVLKGIEPKPVIDPGLTLYGVGCIYRLNQ